MSDIQSSLGSSELPPQVPAHLARFGLGHAAHVEAKRDFFAAQGMKGAELERAVQASLQSNGGI